MNAYLAGRYSRRLELCGYAEDLQRAGHTVVSSWLDGHHESQDLVGTDDEKATWAIADLLDLRKAHLLIAFTEDPRGIPTRGGRHVELGYALALRDTCEYPSIAIVGPRENVFCCLPYVAQFDTWADALKQIEGL